MAKKKWKKLLKKAGKAALIGGALYAATKLGKRAKSKAVSGTDDAGIGVKHFAPDDYNYVPKTTEWIKKKPNKYKVDSGFTDKISPGLAYGQQIFPHKKGGRVTGIAKRGFGRALMKGKK